MAYALKEFCDDCREQIDPESREANLDNILVKFEKLLGNEEFIQEHCGPHAEVGVHTIYHDPETDFRVLAHINDKGRTSPPHDHGASWAIYGQAIEWTDMTEFDRKDDGTVDGKAELEVNRKYRLDPGKAGYFAAHCVHSIHFPDNGRFIRVTGTDLTKLETLRYNMDENAVTRVTPNMKDEAAGSAAA